MKAVLLGLLASAALAGSASANTFTLNAYDSIYGAYHETTSSPGSLAWETAGFGWTGNIDLTEGGLVIADIETTNDYYYLLTADPLVGAPCVASACIAVTDGETVSLYDTINSLNGGNGICCDFNGYTPQITINGVPKSSTWAMMLLGVGALGVFARRRRGAASLAA